MKLANVGLLAFLVLFGKSAALQSFQNLIPNGNKVPSPCEPGVLWNGVGHQNMRGSGPLNPFGSDFAKMGKKWSPELCNADSDGDGKTNGQELGDPECTWSGATLTTESLSHPGVCEPITSPSCQAKNSFLLTIPTCQKLLSPNTTETDWCPAIKGGDVKTLSLKFTETTVPPTETNYYCQTFSVPNDQNYHIIAWEPIIVNPEVMHHMILFVCDTEDADQSITKSNKYTTPEDCGLSPWECPNSNIQWAFGVNKMCYNDDAGYLMGGSAYRKVILQIHYNNPELDEGLKDSSGIKLYYTANRRANDMTLLRIGQFDIAIPPQSAPASTLTRIWGRAFSSKSCSEQLLSPSKSFKITSMLFHMHKFGRWAKIILQKANTNVTILDAEYLYHSPNAMFWKAGDALTVEPGDNLLIECSFASPGNGSAWVTFGASTQDEMCLAGFDLQPRPKNLNFLELSNWGTLDNCEQTAMRDQQNPCSDEATKKVRDALPAADLQSNCETSKATCCDFLRAKAFYTMPCIYQSSMDVVKANLAAASLTAQTSVFSTMLSCIADEMNRPIAVAPTVTQQNTVSPVSRNFGTNHNPNVAYIIIAMGLMIY